MKLRLSVLVILSVVIGQCLMMDLEEYKRQQKNTQNLLEYEGRESRVVELNEDNYDDFVKENNEFLVFFYIPHCKMSEKIGKTLDKVSLTLEEEGGKMKIGRMNNQEQYKLYNRLGIERPPPELYFQKGDKRTRLAGHHMSERQLVNEVLLQAGQYPLLVTQKALEHYIHTLPLFYVYVSPETIPSSVLQPFTSPLHRDKMLIQIHTLDNHPPGTLLVHRKDLAHLQPCHVQHSVLQCIQTTFLPSLVSLDLQVVEYLMDKHGQALLVFNKPDDHLTTNSLKQVSEDIRRTGLVVVQCDMTTRLAQKMARFMRASELPYVVIADASQVEHAIDMKRYSLNQTISPTSLLSFASHFHQGLLQQQFKSQPIEITEENGVNVYVGSNFRNGVFRKHKATFLIIYSLNTGLTRILMPVIEKLAQVLKDFDGVQVCKINGQENELDGVIYHGYPSIKFIAAGSEKAIEYEEDLGLDDILKYLATNVVGLQQYLDNQKQVPKQEL